MDTVTLNTGTQMPQLGFGVYQVPVADTEQVVGEAIRAGFRHIDTAQYYGNEVGVGRAVRSAIEQSDGALSRTDFFITTKVSTSGYSATKAQIRRALENLQTDYIDLVLIHWVVADYEGTYRALEEAYKEGTLKAIGLSNFNERQIRGILSEFDVTPAVLQNEMHVFHQQTALRAFCAEKGIQFESWAPFGEGRENIFAHPVLSAIGHAYGKTAAQVILRFLMQSDVVAIPKTVNPSRMAENFAIFDFALSEDDMARIRELDRGRGLFGWNE